MNFKGVFQAEKETKGILGIRQKGTELYGISGEGLCVWNVGYVKVR